MVFKVVILQKFSVLSVLGLVYRLVVSGMEIKTSHYLVLVSKQYISEVETMM